MPQYRIERAVGVVGRALQTDFGMPLDDVRKHGLAQAGFAETGLARQQKKLSLSSGSDGPTVKEERKLGVAADETGSSWVASGAEATGVVVCGDDLPGRDAGVKTLQRHRANRFELKQIPDERTRAGGDNHAVARGCGLQARRQVWGFAEHSKFGGGADRDRFADYDDAAGNADTAGEFGPVDGSHGRHRGNDIEPGSNGAFGIVLVRLRITEIDEHAIAHKFGHEAFIAGGTARHLTLVGIDYVSQTF